MVFIGIVGARKFKDRKAVDGLIERLPDDSTIVTSRCRGVCTWTQEKAKQRNLEVIVYQPDLSDLRSRFEVPKRYYQRNRELVERCNLVHAFFSNEGGYEGGTRFEAEYALSLAKPVMFHWEKGASQLIYQKSFSFMEDEAEFCMDWEAFFVRVFA